MTAISGAVASVDAGKEPGEAAHGLPAISPLAFRAMVLTAGIVVTAIVTAFAWVSDDAFITFRYVRNTLGGFGSVFNVGERVQGYTHPLWFLALLPGVAILRDAILVAVVYGIVLTLLTIVGLGEALRRLGNNALISLCRFLVVCLILVTSSPWISFQTSGLEGSLSNFLIFLIAMECCFNGVSHPARLVLLMNFLCLTRPDFAVLSLPLTLMVLFSLRSARAALRTLLAATPGMAWVVFARLYYGHVMPNTALAKVGVFETWWVGVQQGGRYLADWTLFDPVAAACTVVFLAIALVRWRNGATVALAIGFVLYAGYVVSVGGDFMRGRFFMPLLTGSLIVGSLSLQRGRPRFVLEGGLYALLLAVGAANAVAGDALREKVSMEQWGVADEQRYYPGYGLRAYLREGRVTNPYTDVEFADALRSYVEACGPVTIHLRNPGMLGYYAGPGVTVIDMLGLTDRTIAQLPRSHLTHPHPRPGHAEKFVPVGYLASRHDVSIIPGWEARILQKDCRLKRKPLQYRGADWLWDPAWDLPPRIEPRATSAPQPEL